MVITENKFNYDINNFSAYTFPGPDGLMLAMLQKQQENERKTFTGVVFCSGRYCTPEDMSERGAEVGHESTKDLTSVGLKTLEHFLDVHSYIMERLLFSLFSDHAYFTLHAVIRAVERSTNFQQRVY